MKLKTWVLLLIFFSMSFCVKHDEDIESLMTNQDIRQMVRLVNETRSEGTFCGESFMEPVQQLVWDQMLEELALEKSYDMYSNNYFAHGSPSGITLKKRLDSINYSYFYQGENIALGAIHVKEVMNEWLSSEGHCKNLMNPKFTHFGAAQYGTYWTQEFIGR